MDTVTTAQLDASFRTAILGITPTFEASAAARWSYVEAGRTGARADLRGRATRTFTTIWGVGSPTYFWVGGVGTAYKARLAIATSYASTAPSDLQHMITADQVDLRRTLNALRDPTVGGLTDVRDLGLSNELIDDDGNVYLEHTFDVHYHQSTE